MAARRPLPEVLAVYAVVCAITFAVTRLRGSSPLADYVHLIVGGLFLVAAVRLAQREPEGLARHGIELAGLLSPPDEDDDRAPGPFGLFDLGRALGRAAPAALRETGAALLVALVIFPPFAVGFFFWHGPARPFALTVPPDFGSFALAQVLVVALPEEAFFRGYVQTRLGDAFPRRVRLLGAELSPAALVGQAALFGLVHFLVDLDPQRLAVFFPGLLFGWMRARRGGIGAPMALHALSNVYSELLMKGFGL